MRLGTITGLSAAAVGLLTSAACANVVSLGVFSTGNNGTTLITGSSPDPAYTITSAPVGITPGTAIVTNEGANNTHHQSTNPSAWLPNSTSFTGQASSQWIAPQANGSANDPAGTYDYVQTFTLTNNDILNTGEIKLQFAGDNSGLVYFNGTLIGSTSGGSSGYAAFSPVFTITSGFQDGINTLLFVITNNAGAGTPPGGTPTGLNVSVIQDTIDTVPEPSAIAAFSIAGLMLGGLILRGRRQARRTI